MSSEDENARSAESTTVANTEVEPTLEEAMKNIFSACDTENVGVVSTAKLIEYISPFMAYNRTELMQLQEMLDPQDENVLVSKEKFYAAMNDWAGRISAANESENFREAVPKDFYKIEEEDCPFVQSTPRSSFGHHFLRGYAVSGIPNISLFSECSGTASAALDKTIFEERLKELTHQNRKLAEELTQAKVQLTSSEEYIENLQADLNKVVRRLNSEQHTNEQLQKRVEESDGAKETSEDLLLQYSQLKKEREVLEKENAALRDNLDALDDEKCELVRQVERYKKSKCDLEQQVLQLNKELQVSEERMSEMGDVVGRLKMEVKELQSDGETYKQRSEELLAENQTLEKLLHKLQLQQTTTTTTTTNRTYNKPRSSSCCSPSGILSPQTINSPLFLTATCSPLEKIRQHCLIYNSPNLVKQLNNPLSPLASTPEEKACENSPEFTSFIKSSTPKQLVALLDDSIPAELAKVSVLCPNMPLQSAMCVVEKSMEGQTTAEIVRNNTSEEDYWKVNITEILEKQSPHTSLHAELSEVMNGSCVNGSECVHLIRLMDINGDFLKVQQELVEQKNVIEKLQKQNEELRLNKSHNESVGSNSSVTYVTEVRMRVDQEAGDASSVTPVDLYETLNTLKTEKQQLTLKLRTLQEDNEKLTKYNRNNCENFMVVLRKVATLQDELKAEIQAVLTENCLLREVFNKNTQLKEQIDDLRQQCVAERIEWVRQKEELESRIDDFSMEVTVLQQKLEKNEMVDAAVGCNFYEDDVVVVGGGGGGREKNDKAVLSFSRMQMKVDKLQERVDSLEELLRNEKNKVQLHICKEVVLKREIDDLKLQLSEAALERNQFELKLVQANTVLQNTEIEMTSLRNEFKNLTEKVVELKEIEINVLDTVHCIYKSNLDTVALLKETILSHCVNSPLISVLNSWTDSLNNNSSRLDVCVMVLQPEEATFDAVTKVLTEHIKDLREMVLFNKQFSETLKSFLQDISCQISVQSSVGIKPPESPDSPQEECGKIESTAFKEGRKCDEEDLNSSAVSLDGTDKWSSLSSDCKEEKTQSLLETFKELSHSRAFPNLSDALLESLNTHQDSSRRAEISDNEIAEKYTTLMTVLATDALSIKQRQENLKQRLSERKKHFLHGLQRFTDALEVVENCTVGNAVRDTIRDFFRVCAFAKTCGAVEEEAKVHKWLTSIRSYVVVLTRKVEMVEMQQSIRMVTRLHPQKTYLENDANFIGSLFENNLCKSSSLKKCGRGIWHVFYYGVCILITLTIFTILGNTVSDMMFASGGSVRRFSYPLKDLFWDEFLTPISKKVYCVKECPH